MSTNKRVAVIDVDGVLYDFVGQLAEITSLITGRPLYHFPPAEVYRFMVDDWKLTMDEYLEIMELGVRLHELFKGGVPFGGALVGWDKLVKTGCKIHIATHCGITQSATVAQQHRVDWLADWDFHFDAIDFTADKAAVAKRYLDLGWEVASLEDYDKNFHALEEVGARSFLVHQRWNRHVDTPNRVRDVEEFVNRTGWL